MTETQKTEQTSNNKAESETAIQQNNVENPPGEKTIVQKKSLAETMASFMGDDAPTPTDVAMKLLDPECAIMHTEIRNLPLMNALGAMIQLRTNQGRHGEAAIWQKLYDLNVLHMIPYKRQRAKEIQAMYASLQLQYQQSMGYAPEQKKGLFGGKR